MSEKPHKYDYDIDLSSNCTGAHIIRMMGNNKRILELGAGPGSITKHLKEINNCKVVAIENDELAIDRLSRYCEKIYKADLNDENWASILSSEDKFDVVLAADVLEHLYNPWEVLKTMKGLLTDDGCIIVSLPHIGHNAVLAGIMEGRFDYKEWGLLDKTHIRFFGMRNIKQLFDTADLRISNIEYVLALPDQTELTDNWEKLSRRKKLALFLNKYGSIYQVIIKASAKINDIEGMDPTIYNTKTKKLIFIYKCKLLVLILFPSFLIKILRYLASLKNGNK